MATETITVGRLASRVAGRRSANLAGAIYGTIVATAVVAGLGERASVSPRRALWILLASGLFFWAAHVYSSLLARRIQSRRRTTRADVRTALSREWPLFYSSFPLAVPLVLGWAGVFSGHLALGVATFVGVLTLVGWGIVFSRREGYGLTGIVAAASINAAVGLFIVGLKVAVR
jgi:hypothetical protein